MPGTQIFSLQDGAAYPYEAGVAGDLVDVVGIRSCEQASAVEEVQNRGDGKVMSTATDFGSLDLTFTLAAYTPVSVAAISGGTVTQTGTGATSVTKHSRKSTDEVPYFKFAAQTRTKDSDGGAARVTYPKCAWVGGPDFALTDNEFAEITVNGRALPSDADSELYLYEAYATWTPLA